MQRLVTRTLGSAGIALSGLIALVACAMPLNPTVSATPGQGGPTSSESGIAQSATPGSTDQPPPGETAKPTAEPSPQSSPNGNASATIVIAGEDPDGAHVSASGYISGVIENGGTCKFTFTGVGNPVVVSSVGVSDRSSTSCGLVQASTDEFSPGMWTVVLTYASSTSSATSTAQGLEIK